MLMVALRVVLVVILRGMLMVALRVVLVVILRRDAGDSTEGGTDGSTKKGCW
jgi:hypothetical protein